MTFLPYYCPTFRTDHLVEPCQKNLARVAALKEAKKHTGPIELCVECKGKVLITKPRTIIEGLPAPESWVERQFVKEFKPYRQDWDKSLEEGRLSTEAEALAVHPAIPERRAAGHNLDKKYKKREKILPEVPKKVKERTLAPPDSPIYRTLETETALEPPAGARYCPTHPEMLQHIDKLGRWMGMCSGCLSARGKKYGEQNFERGVTAPPVSIPLNMPKYVEVKEWLAAQAEENERSLGQQIMFTLKMAWRQGI